METLGYQSQISNTRTPVMSVVIQSPGATPRHVRLIGGYPFEAFILNRKRYIIPYLCDYCEEIRDDLVAISDDITQLSSTKGTGQDPALLLDQDVSEWNTNEPIFTSLFDADRFGITSPKAKQSKTEPVKEEKYYTGFRQGNAQRVVQKSTAKDKKPVVLKYSHKGVNPYREDIEVDGAAIDNVDKPVKPEELLHNIPTVPFHYTDSRMQILPHSKSWKIGCNEGSYEDNCRKPFNNGEFHHYDESHLYIEQYKIHKHMCRSSKNKKRKNISTSGPPTLPKIQLHTAYRPGWEFWETFDTASSRQRSRVGDGYVSNSHKHTSLPKVDVAKETMMNLTIMEMFKREQKLAKKRKKQQDMKEVDAIRQGRNKKDPLESDFPLASYYSDGCLLDYPSLRGRTAPKHFMDNFNTLKVKSTAGRILNNEELEKVIDYQDNCGLTIRQINNEEELG